MVVRICARYSLQCGHPRDGLRGACDRRRPAPHPGRRPSARPLHDTPARGDDGRTGARSSCTQLRFESGTQPSATTMQQDPLVPVGQAEELGDLGGSQSLHISQDDDLALGVGQGLQEITGEHGCMLHGQAVIDLLALGTGGNDQTPAESKRSASGSTPLSRVARGWRWCERGSPGCGTTTCATTTAPRIDRHRGRPPATSPAPPPRRWRCFRRRCGRGDRVHCGGNGRPWRRHPRPRRAAARPAHPHPPPVRTVRRSAAACPACPAAGRLSGCV